MSAAEVLRRAAALMRERAGVVPSSPWWADGHTMRGGNEGRALGSAHNAERTVAEHIASWHPDVALAVADWLDAMHEHFEAECFYDFESSCLPHEARALAVARAYLNEPAAAPPRAEPDPFEAKADAARAEWLEDHR